MGEEYEEDSIEEDEEEEEEDEEAEDEVDKPPPGGRNFKVTVHPPVHCCLVTLVLSFCFLVLNSNSVVVYDTCLVKLCEIVVRLLIAFVGIYLWNCDGYYMYLGRLFSFERLVVNLCDKTTISANVIHTD